jgi:hypothetical protein
MNVPGTARNVYTVQNKCSETLFRINIFKITKITDFVSFN